jgi:hypothetical protein
MGNTENIRIGDVEVYVNDGSGERHLGHTLGGVDFSFERETTDLTVDQYGSTPVNVALTGNNLTVVVRLAEITNENIALAIPEGIFSEGSNDSKVGLGRDAGFLLGDEAVAVRLHPRNKDEDDRDEDIYLWKAVSSEPVELAYRVDEQRVLETTLRALIDESQPEGQRLGRVGDADIS